MKIGAKFLAQTQTLTKHAEFRDDVDTMLSVANKQELPVWEDMHVRAAHLCALGYAFYYYYCSTQKSYLCACFK